MAALLLASPSWLTFGNFVQSVVMTVVGVTGVVVSVSSLRRGKQVTVDHAAAMRDAEQLERDKWTLQTTLDYAKEQERRVGYLMGAVAACEDRDRANQKRIRSLEEKLERHGID